VNQLAAAPDDGSRHTLGDEVRLPPYHCAALVAPAADRVFLTAMDAAWGRGGADLSRRYGGPAATGALVEFRTRLAVPGGTVGPEGLAAVYRYRDPATCQRALDKQVAHGMIHRDTDGIAATERGRAFLSELYELHARVTGELWEAHRERVARLVDMLGRALAAADARHGERDGGAGFAAVAPPYEPDGTPPGVLLLNRLGTLRHHRADAHAAAWAAAGHTARSIVELPAGAERLAIELETDRRAAGPYTVLSPAERLTLLADLAALPT
jgi:hypothetical protein